MVNRMSIFDYFRNKDTKESRFEIETKAFSIRIKDTKTGYYLTIDN